MITKREKDLLWGLQEAGYFSLAEDTYKIDYHIDQFKDENSLEVFKLFRNISKFTETEFYKDFILNNFEDAYGLLLANDGFSLKIPANLKKDEVLKLLDEPNFAGNMDRTDFTEKYFWVFTHDKENLLKYKKYFDWNVVIRREFTLSEIIIETCAEELSNISYSTLLPIIEKLYNESIKPDSKINLNSYYFSSTLHRLENFNSTNAVDVHSKETVEKLLETIRFMKYYKEYDEECLSENAVGYGEDIRDFYSNLYKDFNDEFIINNIKLFDPEKIQKTGRMNEKILTAFLDSGNIYSKDINNYLNENKDLSLDFLRKYKDSKELYLLDGFYKQRELMKLYKENNNRIDPVKIYLYNEFVSDYDLKLISDNKYFYEKMTNYNITKLGMQRLLKEKNDAQ